MSTVKISGVVSQLYDISDILINRKPTDFSCSISEIFPVQFRRIKTSDLSCSISDLSCSISED